MEKTGKEMVSERQIEEALVKAMKKFGGLAVKLTSPGNAGMPDRLCLSRGKAVFVELKAPGKKPRALQVVQHKRLEELGFKVFVIDSLEAIEPMIIEAFCVREYRR